MFKIRTLEMKNVRACFEGLVELRSRTTAAATAATATAATESGPMKQKANNTHFQKLLRKRLFSLVSF